MADQTKQLTKAPATIGEWIARFETDVMAEITTKQQHGLSMPKDFNAQNALEGAISLIKTTVDKEGQPALSVCTPDSIKHAVIETLTKGLDPGHKQCYFIVYGKQLTMFESYFGWILRAMRADANIAKINAQVVFKTDKFGYDMVDGVKCNPHHEQDPDNVDTEIRGAYCVIIYKDGTNILDYMPIAEIRRSWARGATKGASSAHKDQPSEMAKRTVIKRLLRNVVNTTSNGVLLADAMDEIEEEQDREEAVKDITPPELQLPNTVQANPDTGEVIEPPKPATTKKADKKQEPVNLPEPSKPIEPAEQQGFLDDQSLFGNVPDALKD